MQHSPLPLRWLCCAAHWLGCSLSAFCCWTLQDTNLDIIIKVSSADPTSRQYILQTSLCAVCGSHAQSAAMHSQLPKPTERT